MKSAQVKRTASDAVLPEIEQARARAGGSAAIGLNEVFDEQQAVVTPAAGTGVIMGPAPFTPLNRAGKTSVTSTVQGTAGVGANLNSVAAIEHSDDGGATWTVDQAAPLSALTAAGIAAATTSGTVVSVDYPNAGFPVSPGAPRQFRTVVLPAGGNFTTLLNQGSMRIQEL